MQKDSVFISYVREDSDIVDRLKSDLESRGIKVWIDRQDIEPGTRWKDAIRRAIIHGSFFFACFSKAYNEKTKSYMNEELTLAIEEIRKRPTEQSWFIPIKLSECEIPDRNIGAGETLQELQYVELHKDWDDGIRRILSVIPPATGDLFVEKKLRLEFVYLPAGKFIMGSPKNEPGRYSRERQHEVKLTHGFYMQTTPVTRAQWDVIIGFNPSDYKNCGDDCPVNNVSWYDTQDFIKRLHGYPQSPSDVFCSLF